MRAAFVGEWRLLEAYPSCRTVLTSSPLFNAVLNHPNCPIVTGELVPIVVRKVNV